MRIRKRILALFTAVILAVPICVVSTTSTVSKAATDYGVSNPTTSTSSTKYISFGSYWQEDTNGDGVVDKNDEKQQIKWRVLSSSGNDAFLIADQNLDVQQYHTSEASVTWETSYMRTWLNSTFYNNAFSTEEQAAIKTTTVTNSANPEEGTVAGNNTSDKVYLLSIDEATSTTYGFTSSYDTLQARISLNTGYAAAGGELGTEEMEASGAAEAWWLRSPGSSDSEAACIDTDGGVDTAGTEVDSEDVAVRPVLHLDLSTSVWEYTTSDDTEASMTTTWDCIYLGNYWQTDTNDDDTADQNDIKQAIKWRVLSVDGDDALLLADENLDAYTYNSTSKDVTWETSGIRTWLNSTFYNNAFSSSEKSAILTTTLDNSFTNPTYGTAGGNNTSDKVFLLSTEDVTNTDYGFPSSATTTSTSRSAENTDYADESVEWDTEWWLRTPGYSLSYASYVTEGVVYDYGEKVNATYAVRPAIHINLSSSAWEYAGTVTSDGVVKNDNDKSTVTVNNNQVVTDTNTNATYKIISAKKRTVQYQKFLSKTAKKATVPATIKIAGKKYTVISIASKAMKGKKKLKSVVIGKNIKTIGKKAFYGCKKLKKITIKTKKLKKVGNKAFKKIAKKAVFKAPKSKLKAYKKLLKRKTGFVSKTMKLKK